MPQIIDVPGMGQVEFPDGMSDEEIVSAIKKNTMAPPSKENTSFNPFVITPENAKMAEEQLRANTIDSAGGQGFRQGITELGDTGNKFVLSLANMAGVDNNLPVNYKDYRKFADDSSKAFDESEAGKSMAGQAGKFVGANLPYAFVPGGLAGNIGRRMLTGGLAMSGIGAVNDVAEQNKMPINTIVGGVAGSLAPPLVAAGKAGFNLAKKPFQWAYNYAFPEKQILEKTANVIGGDIDNVVAAKQAGNRIGMQLTPAEASGNPLLAQMQGSAGTSEKGADRLHQFGKTHLQEQKNTISDFINSLSPTGDFAANDIRKASQNIISKQEKKLSNQARPFYEKAYQYNIPEEQFGLLTKDPVINQALQAVQKNPIYQTELLDVSPTSLKVLDVVKRNIDDQISMAIRSGEKNKARLLMKSKEKLVNTLDSSSPAYQSARSIFGDGAAPLQTIKESNIGKLADLSDQRLKNTSKIIFDPSQTDMKVLPLLRDQISKENPVAWQQIVRNEMERRLDKTSGIGTNFYNKILKSDRDFNQFSAAIKNIPGAQQKLADMKLTFKNLLNPVSSKTAATLAKSSLDVPRSTSQMVKNVVDNILGGRYDNAMIDFITNPNWDKKLLDFMKASPKKINNYDKANMLTNAFEKMVVGNIDIRNSASQDSPLMNNQFVDLPAAHQ